jgi:hypothetical protein
MDDEPVLMPKGRVIIFGVYLILLNVMLVYLLVRLWPSALELKLDDRTSLFWGDHLTIQVPPETRYLLVVIVAGALGSYIHLATSFADYVGNRRLFSSWGWWYILRPFIGMALAIILYFVIRGGLISATGGAGNLNPYGVAAIAGMAGMFSKQATDKLREVFENLFKTERPPDRADKLEE